METDAEPQPNIRPNWTNPVEEEKEGLYKSGAKGTTRKPTESSNMGS